MTPSEVSSTEQKTVAGAGFVMTDCRSDDGVTVGLIDGIISSARVLAKRDLSPPAVAEALKDLRADEDVAQLLGRDVWQGIESDVKNLERFLG